MNTPEQPIKVLGEFDFGSQKSSRVIPTWFGGLPESSLSISTDKIVFPDTYVDESSEIVELVISNSGFREQVLLIQQPSKDFAVDRFSVTVPSQGEVTVRLWFTPTKDTPEPSQVIFKTLGGQGFMVVLEGDAKPRLPIYMDEDDFTLDDVPLYGTSDRDIVLVKKRGC